MILRLRAAMEGRALWIDEVLIANEIMGRGPLEIATGALGSSQVASPGFMLMTKLSTWVLGEHDFFLRSIPLIAGVASLVLFSYLASRIFFSPTAVAGTVGIFALAPVLVYYSTELKPYSLDIFATVFALAAVSLNWSRDKPVLLAIGIFFLTYSSVVAIPIFAFVIASHLFFLESGPEKMDTSAQMKTKRFLLLISSYVMGSIGNAVVVFRSESLDMRSYWSNWDAMAPAEIGSLGEFLWLARRILGLFADPFFDQQVSVPLQNLQMPYVAFLFFLLVVVGLWAGRRKKVALMAFGIFVTPVLLSVTYLYPMGGRVTLFVLPALILLAGFGLEFLSAQGGSMRKSFALALSATLLATPLLTSLGYFSEPNDRRDTKEALKTISENSISKSAILIDPANAEQISFYSNLLDSDVTRVNLSNPLDEDTSLPSDHEEYWILSTHKLDQARAIEALLIKQGFANNCRFNQDLTYLAVWSLDESTSEKCVIER